MTKYHLSGGVARRCRAQHRCPFGGGSEALGVAGLIEAVAKTGQPVTLEHHEYKLKFWKDPETGAVLRQSTLEGSSPVDALGALKAPRESAVAATEGKLAMKADPLSPDGYSVPEEHREGLRLQLEAFRTHSMGSLFSLKREDFEAASAARAYLHESQQFDLPAFLAAPLELSQEDEAKLSRALAEHGGLSREEAVVYTRAKLADLLEGTGRELHPTRALKRLLEGDDGVYFSEAQLVFRREARESARARVSSAGDKFEEVREEASLERALEVRRLMGLSED